MSKRSILTRLVVLIPALVLMGAMLAGTMSCGGGLFPEVTATATPTNTPSPGTGNFAYATDLNTAKLVPFARNTTTGFLTAGKALSAGATGSGIGPKGMAITSGNDFIYVANGSDNNIYGYSIGSNGTPSPLSTPSFPEGSGTSPQQITIDASGSSFMWVTNSGNASITNWTISSNGTLTGNQTQSAIGLSQPFGIVNDGTYVYVADPGNGTVSSFSILSGGLLSVNSSQPSLGTGSPGKPTKIVLDPNDNYVYVADFNNSYISAIGILTGGILAPAVAFPRATETQPFGLGITEVSSAGTTLDYLLVANQATTVNGSFNPITTPGTVGTPGNFPGNNVSVPTGLAVAPQNNFFYTADQNDGTVGQWSIGASGCAQLVCFVRKVFTEGTSTTTGPFDVILTN
ncbi:MAG TPA: beta-propeller fold lactonase family protein [Candidatus Binataceae bacterium]|nr:beta-propeller fold lactonase family protein [Candidatus Binataceae bacterium]